MFYYYFILIPALPRSRPLYRFHFPFLSSIRSTDKMPEKVEIASVKVELMILVDTDLHNSLELFQKAMITSMFILKLGTT